MGSNDPIASMLAVGLACLWLTYSINVILSLKVVLFYESYLTIMAFVTRKKITIQYHESVSYTHLTLPTSDLV